MLGQCIHDARTQAGVSLTELARATGIHRNKLADFEKGKGLHPDKLALVIAYLKPAALDFAGLRFVRSDILAEARPELLPEIGELLKVVSLRMFGLADVALGKTVLDDYLSAAEAKRPNPGTEHQPSREPGSV